MDNMKPKKPSLKKVLALLLLAALIIVSLTFYKSHNDKAEADKAYQADVARFAAVEADMTAVRQAIVTGAGVPAFQVIDNKGCGYNSQKYSKGDLYCNIRSTFVYAENDAIGVASRMNSVIEVLKNGRLLNLTSMSIEKAPVDVYDANRHELFFDEKHGMVCTLAYKGLESVDYSRYSISDVSTSRALMLDFECSDNVQQPVYTLAE